MNNITSNSTNLNTDISENGLTYFKAYDSQLAIPEVAGSRVVKCLYKTDTKTGKKAGTNSYIRIPTSHLSEQLIADKIAELAPHVLSFLRLEEDKSIKELHKKGTLNIHIAALSLDKIIESLEESSVSGRMTSADIEKWFDDYLVSNLADLFATKMNINAEVASELELEKLHMILDAYKKKFASLASPKASFIPDDCSALIKVIRTVFTEGENIIGNRFIARLEKIAAKGNDTLMSL